MRRVSEIAKVVAAEHYWNAHLQKVKGGNFIEYCFIIKDNFKRSAL